MTELTRSRAALADEAVEWFLRQQEIGFGADERRALAEWLLLSPLHVEEYLAVSLAWGVAGAAQLPAPEGRAALLAAARAEIASGASVVPLRTGASVENPALARARARAHRWPRWAVGALLLVAGGWLASWALRDPEYSTVHGEQRSLLLADGSLVTLNTDTRIRVSLRAAERDVELLAGEGRFQVAKDPRRPFVVSTSGARVRALGTVFNVRVAGSVAEVAVIEGHVSVAAARDSRAAVLKAGERATIRPGTVELGSGQLVESANAWTERKLVFRDERLATVVEQFNRYRVHPLALDDAQLGELRISGVFAIEDPESLLGYLRQFETVDIRHEPDGTDHLARAGAR